MNTKTDVVVIGGGPSGMMAAGRAAERGLSVLLLEKNKTLGKKLLITGGGRCNLTNNIFDVRLMLAKYKNSKQFLFSAFSQFSVKDTLSFFNKRGVPTKEENEGRIFPVSDNSDTVLGTLMQYMKEGGVDVRTGVSVVDISIDDFSKNINIYLKNREKITTKYCIVATGGVSYPKTGSTGDGFVWLKKMGHKIIDNDFSLVPIAIKDNWVKSLSGLALDGVRLTVFLNKQKQKTFSKTEGKILFTHFGVSGPMILNISKEIDDLLPGGDVVIGLDLFPKLDHGAVNKKIQTLIALESNKKIKNILSKIISSALVPVVFGISGINGETFCHSLKKEDRAKLAILVKNIPLNVSELLGADKAIVSSGGVRLEDVDFKTMQSRIAPNIYIVGDVLNINRPSGGYSLQLCWTTGFVAGNSVGSGI